LLSHLWGSATWRIQAQIRFGYVLSFICARILNLSILVLILAEASFLTGLDRNSDVVVMSSYAPLFSLSEGGQGNQNLINFNPAHVLLTANYFVQRIFGTTVGEKVVDLHKDLPARVYASAIATKDWLIVKLVNTNAPVIQTQLNLPDVPVANTRSA